MDLIIFLHKDATNIYIYFSHKLFFKWKIQETTYIMIIFDWHFNSFKVIWWYLLKQQGIFSDFLMFRVSVMQLKKNDYPQSYLKSLLYHCLKSIFISAQWKRLGLMNWKIIKAPCKGSLIYKLGFQPEIQDQVNMRITIKKTNRFFLIKQICGEKDNCGGWQQTICCLNS